MAALLAGAVINASVELAKARNEIGLDVVQHELVLVQEVVAVLAIPLEAVEHFAIIALHLDHQAHGIGPTSRLVRRARCACDKHGALLILDEIPQCLGRTGHMFACEHFDIVPDILVIGKGLGGGIFPFAAMIAREGLNVMASRALGHYTHEKNPVAAAAALATIEVIEQEAVLANVREQGEYALQRLNAMRATHPLIGDVRGLGLMLGVELVSNRETMARAINEAEQVMYRSLATGLNFKLTMGNIITLTPALTISRPEMDRALDILEAAIGFVEGQSATATSTQKGNP